MQRRAARLTRSRWVRAGRDSHFGDVREVVPDRDAQRQLFEGRVAGQPAVVPIHDQGRFRRDQRADPRRVALEDGVPQLCSGRDPGATRLLCLRAWAEGGDEEEDRRPAIGFRVWPGTPGDRSASSH